MPSKKQMRALARLVDPLGLCTFLGKKLQYSKANCDDTFRYTRECLAQYAPDSDPEQVIALLQEMGAHCDCEVGFNICPDTGA